MNEINININVFQGKRVLIAPLNWGMGHAARCIPIIRLFIKHQIKYVIASDGVALALLKEEFPKASFEELPSYNIRYPYKSMEINMLIQAPKIAKAIIREHKVTQDIIKNHKIDIIISDNRFGCRSELVHSIFITHQVQLLAGNPLSTWLANKINRRYIRQFDELWIPDYKGEHALAGKLSNVDHIDFVPIKFINPLSRFTIGKPVLKSENPIDILLILSGPEPARTHLESQLISILDSTDYNTFIVRGTPEELPLSTRIPYANMMNAKALNIAINNAQLVICRSGYTSIMDLYILQKKAILIPTPGQPEQEYLADYHLHRSPFKTWNVADDISQLLLMIQQTIK